ncbi:hypothetical protein DL240_05700 [Lujinxingia litoralis]|uniref:AMIN domain-containing protein n=2 Tax=Lujinxingia litoralis TaxID=2211119 RepID=A0A328C730_9DELT|nr:hypothetical protein DL240_05700 [Lujinxingia litoralis]
MLVALVAMVGVSIDAEAQTVRRFDDAGDGSQSQIYIPGMPVPQPAAAPAAGDAASSQPGGDAEASDEGSYQISLYGTRGRRARASELAARPADELYRGVIPGTRDEMAHLADARRAGAQTGSPNQLTWIGFLPEASRTRVFFQSPRPMRYQVQRGAGEQPQVVLTFENAEIPTRNFSRFIDASFFKRAVTRIDARELSGGGVEVTIDLREEVNPQVSTDGEYLYLDFPHQTSRSTQARAN